MQRLSQRLDSGSCMHRVIISTSIVEPEVGLVTILLATRGATRLKLGRRQVEETMIKHRTADRAR